MYLVDAPEWEDPELQREIAAATGMDLSRQKKKGLELHYITL